MARHDADFRVVPELDRRLHGVLAHAMAQDYGLAPPGKGEDFGPGQTPTFRTSYALSQFFETMSRAGDHGYVAGAWVFAAGLDALHASRTVRSHALTRLARMVYEAVNEPRRPIRESEVAIFGRFVNELIGSMPAMHVEWMEDMNDGDEACGLERQPTAVIRGVLLSPNLDHGRAVRFWELSVSSERFPMRVFSDPCPPDDGAIFSAYQARAFARIFSVAPVSAVERFAAHMREHASRTMRRGWDDDEHVWFVYEVPAQDHVRHRTFRDILGHIADEARRKLVERIFQPEAAPAC